MGPLCASSKWRPYDSDGGTALRESEIYQLSTLRKSAMRSVAAYVNTRRGTKLTAVRRTDIIVKRAIAPIKIALRGR